ncbi:17165_t:CDS:2, partial [Racocetra persica]
MVDDKKERERQQECLRMFRHYFPEMDRGQGVLSKIKGDLEKIKKINDLEEKYQEANLQIEAIKQQEKQKETAKSEKVTKSKLKTNQTQSKTAFKNTQSTQNQTSQKEEYISCTECLQEIKPGVKYHYHKTKKDEKEKQEQKELETPSTKDYCETCGVELTGKDGETNIHCAPCWEKEIEK